MNKTKAVYQLTGRQILMLAFASALIAVGTAACFSNFSGLFDMRNSTNVALAENAPTPVGISNPESVSDEQNSIEVYKSISPGVAYITTSAQFSYYGEEQETERGNGSGSVIDAQGHILTNFHVIEGASKLTVSFGGEKTYPAKVVGGDPDTDLAVIKIEPGADKITVVQLGDSDALQVGQKVLAIGNPFGLDRTLTTGVISGLQRPIRARNGRPIEGAIQTDASINPGNSGGPLLDKYGRMIGINSQILSRSGGSVGVGFAIPVSIAKRVVPQLIQFGEVRRPKLGATLFGIEQLRDQGISTPVESGLLIRSVVVGGSAERSGLRGFTRDAQGEMVFGDIITAVDGEKVTDMDGLYKVLDKKKIGDTVQVEVFRNNKSMTIPVKLLALPASVQGRPRED
ncbi:MAG: trypsin-like peptidase domain-containing protein [Acidobacteria bacterium]|nr:trypsin-like peptidase domain-containing protein [Acidobacteriota bacterium]MBK8813878.1 trypsin-like peptidase domain-containing protein [Acidobacteriota bacterium]